ncbi:diguanylate cyclase [Secundilactobacillus oryzae JCM 18671]|uniref:Diguanylate cyclase n=1 Tax=Secundilactobacillus oryzae JCM 18671 TaxID=1291743 RepID=A0A081BG14_9LACO|nr:hypothetical protein [Secundilactobacillus oryzae]GAK46982.1 diguanylate cyclase [Secundilactobacillus oryzae JCM 18671]
MNMNSSELLLVMTWAAQLLVAVFFIAGFVSFYTEIWDQAFVNPRRSRRERISMRVVLVVLSVGLASILHVAGYISGSSAMMFHNIGLFILVFSLLDADINIGEYLVRCFALVAVWLMHHVNDFMMMKFAVSMIIAIIVMITIWRYRSYIEPHFPIRLLISTIIALDFWFTLPYHSASMHMNMSTSIEAVLMFFLMKLSTGRQQSLWAHN